jgi:tetrahydromethanopterin S-methyltransferase subunit G
MDEEIKTILLPAKLYNRIEERAKLSGFDSVNEYVIFVLGEVMNEDEETEHVTMSKAEEEEIKKRLKELGYLE